MNKLYALSLLYILMLSSLIGCLSHADVTMASKRLTLEQVKTSHGLLRIFRSQSETGVPLYRIVLGKKVILEEKDYFSVFIVAAYPSKADAKLVLLELGEGGSGCAAFYKIIEIKTDGTSNITDEFGNCSDLVSTSYRNGILRVDIEWNNDSWIYKNGKLIKVTNTKK